MCMLGRPCWAWLLWHILGWGGVRVLDLLCAQSVGPSALWVARRASKPDSGWWSEKGSPARWPLLAQWRTQLNHGQRQKLSETQPPFFGLQSKSVFWKKTHQWWSSAALTFIKGWPETTWKWQPVPRGGLVLIPLVSQLSFPSLCWGSYGSFLLFPFLPWFVGMGRKVISRENPWKSGDFLHRTHGNLGPHWNDPGFTEHIPCARNYVGLRGSCWSELSMCLHSCCLKEGTNKENLSSSWKLVQGSILKPKEEKEKKKTAVSHVLG